MSRVEATISPELVAQASSLSDRLAEDQAEFLDRCDPLGRWVRAQVTQRAAILKDLGLFPKIRVVDRRGKMVGEEDLLYVRGSSRGLLNPYPVGDLDFEDLREYIAPDGGIVTRASSGIVPSAGWVSLLDLGSPTTGRRVVEIADNAFLSLRSALFPVLGR